MHDFQFVINRCLKISSILFSLLSKFVLEYNDYCRKKCSFFVRLSRFLLTMDTIDTLFSVYSNLFTNNIIYNVHKRSLMDLIYYFKSRKIDSFAKKKIVSALIMTNQYLYNASYTLLHNNSLHHTCAVLNVSCQAPLIGKVRNLCIRLVNLYLIYFTQEAVGSRELSMRIKNWIWNTI